MANDYGMTIVLKISNNANFALYMVIQSYYCLLNIDLSRQDTELQAWIRDLHDNGYPVREGESCHGIPASVKTADQLNHLLTIIIFTYSCQHAAVNFSQMDTFGFPPNSPPLMRQPPPTEKGTLTEKDMMKSLPTKHQAGVTIATVYDLTLIFPDEVNHTVIYFSALQSTAIYNVVVKRSKTRVIGKPYGILQGFRKWLACSISFPCSGLQLVGLCLSCLVGHDNYFCLILVDDTQLNTTLYGKSNYFLFFSFFL